MTDPLDNLKTAIQLGGLSKLRLRAEVLLGHADAGTIPLTGDDRERLERITVSPREDDTDFLGGFDHFLTGE